MPEKIWEQGVLFIIIAGVGYASYRGVAWLSVHAIMPAVMAHVEFLKVVSDSIKAQTELIKHIDDQLDSLYDLIGKSRGKTEQ